MANFDQVVDRSGYSRFNAELPPVEILLESANKAEVTGWLDNVLAENGDGPLTIGYHLEPGYSLENCLAIHDELSKKGLVQPGR